MVYLPHDTINRVFSVLNSRHIERLFILCTNSLNKKGVFEKIIAIDGKTLQVSKDIFHPKSAVHMVHA